MKHFTSTAYVVARVDGEPKVLLHFHKKLGSWLPPGGHLEENESPEECALREVMEETGLKIGLLAEKPFKEIEDSHCAVMLQPALTLLEKIGDDHYHMDFTFFAKAESTELKMSSESHDVRWCNKKELEGLNAFDNVKKLAAIALKKVMV